MENPVEIVEVKTVPISRESQRMGRIKPRVYFWIEDYNPIVEMMSGERYNTPHKYFRKLMPNILAEVGLPKDRSFGWSQKAGCSCGCSPGFIVEVVADFDISVTYRYKEV